MTPSNTPSSTLPSRTLYDQFVQIQMEIQLDVAEPVTNMARIAFTDSLEKRREKVIARIEKSKTQAASAIARIHPSSNHMFGGDHNQLSKVVH